jgi:hypothetical protein
VTLPTCSFCNEPIEIKPAKTDEYGHAAHEAVQRAASLERRNRRLENRTDQIDDFRYSHGSRPSLLPQSVRHAASCLPYPSSS